MFTRTFLLAVSILLVATSGVAQTAGAGAASSPAVPAIFEYKILVAGKMSTLENEIKEAAAAGYRFDAGFSGDTMIGRPEALVVMSRRIAGEHRQRFEYKLLATSRSPSFQEALQAASDAGFHHRGQAVLAKKLSAEVLLILEREPEIPLASWEYKVLGSKKISSTQKELIEAVAAGYQFVCFATHASFFGGEEVISILRRPRS